MEKFQQCREEARKKLKMADHLLSVTYNVVDDPKILVTAMENVYGAISKAMNSVLEHEFLFKNIESVPEKFEERFKLFSKHAPRLGFDNEHVNLISDIGNIMGHHENAPVEFPKDGKFMMFSDEYDLESLSPEKLKNALSKTKGFMEKVEEVVSENERIFG